MSVAERDAGGPISGNCGYVERADRVVVRFTGDRAAAALNGLLTADLAPLEHGGSAYTLVLSPKGRLLAEGRILSGPRPDSVWFDAPRLALDDLLEHLARYLPPRFATFEADPDLVRVTVLGPSAEAVVETLWQDMPEAAGRFIHRAPWQGGGLDVFVASDHHDALLENCERAGCGPIADALFEAWRIEQGLPAYGVDVGPESLPQETALDTVAVSYEKGCYTGQEVVARIHYRGHVNRHLRRLRSDRPIAAGDELFDGSKAVGSATSVASERDGSWIALGTVRREIEAGSHLSSSVDGEPDILVEDVHFTLT